jgi:hypothetical protein
MVQVDVFWSYGIGASFAFAAARQLADFHKRQVAAGTTERKSVLETLFFTKTVLFLAIIFAPSGLYLVWAFPSWETMHVGDKNMPAWLVTLFAVTNITQGVLGFWVAYRLIAANKTYTAYLTIVGAYFAMFFILVHGWDGTGYQRFFSETRDDFLHWGAKSVGDWLVCPVALSLYAMGVFLIPVMLGWIGTWIRDGYALDERARDLAPPPRAAIDLMFLSTVLVEALGAAIIASLLIHQLGWILGAIAFAVVGYFFAVSPRGLSGLLYRRLMERRKPRADLAITPSPAVSSGS